MGELMINDPSSEREYYTPEKDRRWWDSVPDEVVIDYRPFPIMVRDLDGIFGEVDDRPLHISLDKDQTRVQAAQTLLHEMMHPVYWSTGCKDIPGSPGLRDIEEFMVGRLSAVLASTMRNNPDVWNWILEGLSDAL